VRILLITQVVPYPPDSGPKVKTFNVLRHLAKRHDIHLLSYSRSDAEERAARTLARYCSDVTTVPLSRSKLLDLANLVRSVFDGRPFLIARDDSRAMRSKIADLMDRNAFDAVHADQLTMAQFAEALSVHPRVLDEHNAVWRIVARAAPGQGLRRPFAELEWRKLRAYEQKLCPRFDHLLVVSEQDLADLETPTDSLSAHVIPITVDTSELKFKPRGADARHVLSIGTMFYPPNVEAVGWFAREVFPRVRPAAAASEFFVVGSRPPRAIQRLAHSGSGVIVTGYMDDPEPVLDRSAVLVVPLRSGGGMRVKILEAFARGLPVVSTSVGIEGIDAVPEVHFLLADEAESFASAVVRLIHDKDEAARIARAARDLVVNRYDWRTALSGLDEIYA
jgi:sugar transferase (PEP-CTERM/EpsH1 system associated)